MQNIKICAVTKGHSIKETESMLKKHPAIRIIAENRWPDCEEKFKYFTKLEKHFIGPLQSNKIRKVLPLVDVIQSVDSIKLMERINEVAEELNKPINFCIQVNISDDSAKHGVSPKELNELIQNYLFKNYFHIKLIGLMTIGARNELEGRAKYFSKFKNLFDKINQEYFSKRPLTILSMGMSDDYKIAIKEGATMIRLGRALYKS